MGAVGQHHNAPALGSSAGRRGSVTDACIPGTETFSGGSRPQLASGRSRVGASIAHSPRHGAVGYCTVSPRGPGFAAAVSATFSGGLACRESLDDALPERSQSTGSLVASNSHRNV